MKSNHRPKSNFFFETILKSTESDHDWSLITKNGRPSDKELQWFYTKHCQFFPGNVEDYVDYLVWSYRKRCGEDVAKPDELIARIQDFIATRDKNLYDSKVNVRTLTPKDKPLS